MSLVGCAFTLGKYPSDGGGDISGTLGTGEVGGGINLFELELFWVCNRFNSWFLWAFSLFSSSVSSWLLLSPYESSEFIFLFE